VKLRAASDGQAVRGDQREDQWLAPLGDDRLAIVGDLDGVTGSGKTVGQGRRSVVPRRSDRHRILVRGCHLSRKTV